MSEGIFLGRKFTIPYDTSTDQKVVSMARAQLVTGTAAPGAVIQVGDKVMAYGITPQEAKMGDLDVRLRSIDQLSAPAQEVVRRNIAWQYGAQVGEVKKSWISRLLGRTHLMTTTESRGVFPKPKERSGELPAPSLFDASPRPAAPQAPKAPPTPKAPAAPKKKPKATAKEVAEAKITAKKKAAPAPATPTTETSPPPAKPATKSAAKIAPKPGKAPEGRMPALIASHLGTAFDTFSRRHSGSRSEGWDVKRERPDGYTLSSVATHGATGHTERHDFRYDEKSNSVIHSYTPPGGGDAEHTHISIGNPFTTGKKGEKVADPNWDPQDLYDYVVRSHDKWAF